MIEDLAHDLASGAWRPMTAAETAEIDALAAASTTRTILPVEPRDAMVADARGSVPRWPPAPDDSYVSGFSESDRVPDDVLDRELTSAQPPGCSIPPIDGTGSASRGDRAEIDLAIRWADGHPNARWFVIRKLGALGLHNRIPSWPEVHGSRFSRDGKTWEYPGSDGSTVQLLGQAR